MGNIDALENLIGLAFSAVTPIIKEIKKDGVQAKDLIAFMSSEDFKSHVEKLAENYADIPAEAISISPLEGIQLGYTVYKELQKMIEEIS